MAHVLWQILYVVYVSHLFDWLVKIYHVQFSHEVIQYSMYSSVLYVVPQYSGNEVHLLRPDSGPLIWKGQTYGSIARCFYSLHTCML